MSPDRRFALVVLCCSCLAMPALGVADSGRWTPDLDMAQVPGWPEGIAVHLMLLKGDGNPYHSRVVWLKGRTPNAWFGGEWGWNPASDACTSWPTTSFTKLNLLDPQANIFCAGHTELGEPGGRTLVVGGTEDASERGMRFAKFLTPGTSTSASTWTTADSMIEKRWYPSITQLKVGALVTTGSKYAHLGVWGGRKDGEVSPSDIKLGRYGIVAAGQWDSDIQPGGTYFPLSREGHTADVAHGWAADIYFGGRRSDRFLDDAFRLYRNANPLGADYDYAWQPTVSSGAVKPAPRFEHSAAVAFITGSSGYGVAKNGGVAA